jgi:hypothetical protein
LVGFGFKEMIVMIGLMVIVMAVAVNRVFVTVSFLI